MMRRIEQAVSILIIMSSFGCRTSQPNSKQLDITPRPGSNVKTFEYLEARFDQKFSQKYLANAGIDVSKICVVSAENLSSGAKALTIFNNSCASMKPRFGRGQKIDYFAPIFNLKPSADKNAPANSYDVTYQDTPAGQAVYSETTSSTSTSSSGVGLFTINNLCFGAFASACSFTAADDGTIASYKVGASSVASSDFNFLNTSSSIKRVYGVAGKTTEFCDFTVTGINGMSSNSGSNVRGFDITFVSTSAKDGCKTHRSKATIACQDAKSSKCAAPDVFKSANSNYYIVYDWASDSFRLTDSSNGLATANDLIFTERPADTRIIESSLQ